MGFKFDRWAMAWLTLSLVLGLHVAEEAVVGSFALYNEMANWLAAFRYDLWVVNLSATILVLVALTWLVAARLGPMWLASYVLALFAVANAALHILLSLSAERLLPGTLSAPLVLAAALFLLVSIPEAQTEGKSRLVAG